MLSDEPAPYIYLRRPAFILRGLRLKNAKVSTVFCCCIFQLCFLFAKYSGKNCIELAECR